MQFVIRSAGDDLVRQFAAWTRQPSQRGTRLFCIEGLPSSGKSFLLKNAVGLGQNLDLDDFLNPPAPSTVTWLDRVLSGGAAIELKKGLVEAKRVLIGGVVAWPVIESAALDLNPEDVRRVYIKRMGTLGENLFWHDGQDLDLDGKMSHAYRASINDYHARCKPWKIADLVIERAVEVQCDTS